MLTCSMMRFLSLFTAGSCVLVLFLWSCDRLWSVCGVVVVPNVDEVVAVTVMRVLLFCVACVSAEESVMV